MGFRKEVLGTLLDVVWFILYALVVVIIIPIIMILVLGITIISSPIWFTLSIITDENYMTYLLTKTQKEIKLWWGKP